MDNLAVKRGAQRLVNLVGAWNNQLLEVLGAMGMREVRRLRGEVGRAMFMEDLDKEIFAPLFARAATKGTGGRGIKAKLSAVSSKLLSCRAGALACNIQPGRLFT